jgi:hypothetical protein
VRGYVSHVPLYYRSAKHVKIIANAGLGSCICLKSISISGSNYTMDTTIADTQASKEGQISGLPRRTSVVARIS